MLHVACSTHKHVLVRFKIIFSLYVQSKPKRNGPLIINLHQRTTVHQRVVVRQLWQAVVIKSQTAWARTALEIVVDQAVHLVRPIRLLITPLMARRRAKKVKSQKVKTVSATVRMMIPSLIVRIRILTRPSLNSIKRSPPPNNQQQERNTLI